MNFLLLAAAQPATEPAETDVLAEALRISGIGMLGIFVVMGLFAAMITLLTKLFPDGEGNT
jgi:hypothetical protein